MADFEICPLGTKHRVAELETALRDYMAQASGSQKSCGHDYFCTCPGDKAYRLLNPESSPVFTDEEKSDMYWESNTADGIAPDEDLPMMLKPQAD